MWFSFFSQLRESREDLEVRELKYTNRSLFIYLDRYKTIPTAHFWWTVSLMGTIEKSLSIALKSQASKDIENGH